MVTRIDLRVHTTAPSSKKNDERFKAQAQAYSIFTSATSRVIIPSKNGSLPTDDLHSPSHAGHVSETNRDKIRRVPYQNSKDDMEAPYDPTTFLEETQLGYTALESQLFIPSSRPTDNRQGSQHIVESKHIAETHHPANGQPDSVHSYEGESTSSHRVLSQSSYLHSPVLDRSTKKPRLSEDNRRFFQTAKSLLLPFASLQQDVNFTAAGLVRAEEAPHTGLQDQHHSLVSGSNSMPGDDVTSELPSSYSLSDMTSGSSKSKHQSIQRSTSDPGPSPLKPVESNEETADLLSKPLGSPPSPHNDHQPSEAGSTRKPKSPINATFENGKTVAKDFASHEVESIKPQANGPHQRDFPDLPTSVRAPPPQPSIQPFETHITEALKYLGENKGLTECYKPVFVSRELRQSERGSWKFNIGSWPAQLQVDFFQFLARMIEAGRVGWGIWCVREAQSLDVQVFCWGEAVRHVYLMLYVASKSKVRKLGLKWIDSEGNVVVQMRGTDE